MDYTQEELLEAKRQIDSTIHKLKETVKTLKMKENSTKLKSQITLAKRRVKAFEIANHLIEKELGAEEAPCMNSNGHLITGSICGVKVQEIEDPLMQEIRYLDKLVDELVKGKPMEKILRK